MKLKRVELQDGTTCYTAAPPPVFVPASLRTLRGVVVALALLAVVISLQLWLPVGV